MLTLQPDTALSQNCLIQSLVNDCTRRKLNTNTAIGLDKRCQILDEYAQKILDEYAQKILDENAQKMVNSGHKQGVARKIIISGLKCYERKLESCAN